MQNKISKSPMHNAPIRKVSAKTKVFKLSINPLIIPIILGLLILSGLFVFNQRSASVPITVDTFMRNLENDQYSRISIQDNGQILAQDKYVLVSEAANTTLEELGSEVEGTKQDLKEITLSVLVSSFKSSNPLLALRDALLGGGQSNISEIIIADDYIIAISADPKTAPLFVYNVTESDLYTALGDAGISISDLPVVTPLRIASTAVNIDSIEARLAGDQIAVMYMMDGQIYARLKTSSISTYSLQWDGGIQRFTSTLQAEGISLSDENVEIGTVLITDIAWGDIFSIVTLLGFLVLGFVLFKGMQGSGNSLMRFGQSKARMFWGIKPDVTFKDVAGVDEAKEELNEIVQFLKTPEKFTKLGARIPKGVLMVGAPGTGKTLLARAIAGEAGVPFFHTSGSEFEEMLVGAGASRVRDLFEKAKKAAPSLIFIDEIDAVARKRGTTVQSSTTEQTLNQILVEMDGFEKNVNVIVIAATNRPDVLDPAILRPGRFDRRVVLHLPDIEGRKQILGIHAANKPLASDADLEKIAKRTVGFSGADLENVLNEAAIIAAKQNKKEINYSDVEEAATKEMMGPARQSKRTKEELQLVAVHEAGHAVVSKFAKGSDPLHRVSIISRGMAGGVTEYLPEDDNRIVTRTKLMSRILVSLGGRAAEDVVLGDISTGASSDIEQATEVARNMVQKFGMSEKLGLVKYGESNELQYLGYGYGEQRDYSDETAKMIDEEVRNLVRDSYKVALELLKKHRAELDKLTALLLEKEVVEREEFEALFNA